MNSRTFISLLFIITMISSCSLIERTSSHRFASGYYAFKSDSAYIKKIYLNITDDTISGYSILNDSIHRKLIQISTTQCQPLHNVKSVFIRKSLDIDITSNLFKLRPSVDGLPMQVTTDLNAALFAGWRFDYFHLNRMVDPLNKCSTHISPRGFDFGVFGGAGSATVNSFNTRNVVGEEYSGVILQYGIAGYIESNLASFGISCGFDYLLSPDRKVWIYNNKPWIGFVVGIALN